MSSGDIRLETFDVGAIRTVSAELTFTLRSNRTQGPSKKQTTVSRNAVSTKLHVMTKVRLSTHSALATTRIRSSSYS
jgi:hypothetical protein